MDETMEMLSVDEVEIESAWEEDEGTYQAEASDDDTTGDEMADQPSGTDGSKADDTENAPSQEDGEQQADQPELFTLKNRDETRQVNRDELIVMAQKGWDYDTVRQERDQLRQYRGEADPAYNLVKNYAQKAGLSVPDYLDYCRKQELMAQGINEQTATAQIALEKQQAAVQEQNTEASAARQRQEALLHSAKQRAEARRREMTDFLETYPNVKADEIPKEVWKKVAEGAPLVASYTMYKNQQLEAALAAERQNKQNAIRTTGNLTNHDNGGWMDEFDQLWYEDE